MKKNVLWLCVVLMMAFGISSCSSDDDSSPAADDSSPAEEDSAPATEKSVVGYWQLVGEFNGTQQKPLTDVIVAKFGEDGELTYYENGRKTNQEVN